MQARVILVIALALGTGLGTVKLAQSWLDSERNALQASNAPKAEEVNEAQVLVADGDLPAGRILQEADLRWQPWPEDGVSETYALKGEHEIGDYVGAVLRSRIVAGEPLSQARVVKPGDRGFLAAVLTPGARAVSVPVNETSGIAGLVFPGDRVDIIMTHTMRRGNGTSEEDIRRASETVLRDIRVIAIDQSIDDQSDKPKPAKTATLEVSTEQAEMLNVMMELGTLSLSLRSLGVPEGTEEAQQLAETASGKPAADKITYTLDRDVSRALRDLEGGAPAPVAKSTAPAPTRAVRVVRGNSVRVAEK